MDQAEYKEMEGVEKDHFWFVAKRKFLQTIIDTYRPQAAVRILDVGCGTGAVLDFLRSKGYQVTGVDNNEEALTYCRAKGLDVSFGAVEKIDFEDKRFDVVLALDILEHVSDDKKAVEEIFRVLKPGGILIATVPAHQWLWSYHDVALHHHRRYSLREWQGLFGDTRYTIRLITWLHACILLPALVARKIQSRLLRKNSGSDVKKINPFINILGKIVYFPELIVFKIFKKLPFGVSLVAVIEKR